MATNYSPRVVTDSLEFVVDANNPKGVSGNNTFNLLTGDQNYNYGSPSVTSGGLYCNGSSFIAVDDGTYNFNYVTVSAVYKRNSNQGGEDIVFNKESVWELRDDNGNLQWAVYADNKVWFWQDTGVDIAVGETAAVCLSYDGNYVRFYKNGVLEQTYTYPSGGVLTTQSNYPKFNSRNTTKTSIQNPGDRTLYHWSLYSRALSDDEVAQNYAALRGRFGI